MPNILLKRSLTSGSLPTTASLTDGELAMNVPDGRIFLRKSGSGTDTIESAITTGAKNSGSVQLTGSMSVSGSGDIFTAQGDNIYFTGNTMEFSGDVFEITGSLTVIGATKITGSLGVSQGVTGSLLGTASYAINALSASYAPVFPYTGSARITGSLNIIGDTSLSGSLYISSSTELTSPVIVTTVSGSSSTTVGVGLSKFIPLSYNANQPNIYTDKYIQISYTTSGTDPQLTILTGPSSGRVQVHLFNTVTGAESTLDLLTSTITDIFSTGLTTDTRLDCTISAGADSNWPFYRMTWFRSNTTYGGNIQVLVERFFK